ncbi:MAG: DEAD/DEAH box helicase [Bacteroidales bacterium]|nr:DEAD/DEAH box helicase [Bacteroidales bacterium]
MTFEELGIESRLLKAITEMGFEKPMPVQEQVLPVLLAEDTDLVGLAQTGTGKTAAFGLPAIQRLNTYEPSTEVLILSPTRELCLQIAKDLKQYSKYVEGCSVVAVYGGASIEVQKKELKNGAKIIVATPGRIHDMIRRRYVDLSQVKVVVLDEADEMLDMGFKDDLDAILEQTPSTKNTWLFSATMPDEVARIAQGYMTDPREITVGTRNSGAQNVRHCYYLIQAKDRYLALKRIADYNPNIYAIIFCRTRTETQEVATALIRDGYNADALHGDLSQPQRDHVMNRFRCKNLQMLVATDVAARGLDVSNLTHVINYNLPDEIEVYTHRSGRTGRADKTGISIAIVNLREKHKIKKIEAIIKKKFEQLPIPTGMEVCQKQFFNMIHRVEHVDVNYDEINPFIGEVVKQLEWMDKEELIRRFVSIEFNRFLEYYRNAPDLNVKEKEERKSIEKKAKNTVHDDSGMARLMINLGYKDKIQPQRLIGMINDRCRDTKIKIGKIDISELFTYIDVDGNYANDIIEAFHGEMYRGRPLIVQAAKSKRKDKDEARKSYKEHKKASARDNDDKPRRDRRSDRREEKRDRRHDKYDEKRDRDSRKKRRR